MAREYDLKPAPSDAGDIAGVGTTTINRRQFLRYGFNTAAGVLTASLGMLGLLQFFCHPVVAEAATWPFNFGPKVERTKLGTVQNTCNR